MHKNDVMDLNAHANHMNSMKGGAVRGRPQLLDLPNEILGQIMTNIDDAKSALEVLRSCRRVHALFDATTRAGQRIWQSIRENEGWPDPAPIGITDYEFIRALFGRGCHNCTRHPRIRTPIWQFRGVRLCANCWDQLTVRDYELLIPNAWYAHLPFTRNTTFGYRSYLRTDIPVYEPKVTSDVYEYDNDGRVTRFIQKIQRRRIELSTERARENAAVRQTRQAAILEFLRANVPLIDPTFYSWFKVFQNAILLATPFNKQAQSMFKSKFMREVQQRKRELIVAHVDYYVSLFAARTVGICAFPSIAAAITAFGSVRHRLCSMDEIPTRAQVRAALEGRSSRSI